MDEFQECLEEYQECLEVVQICLDGDNTFELSIDEEELSSSINNNHNNNNNCTSEVNKVNNNNKFVSESEAELSYKSICEEKCDDEENKSSDKISDDIKNNHILKKCQDNFNNDDLSKCSKIGVENSQKLHEELSSEKDGYETCIDESFSEDTCAKNEIKIDDKTPTNSNENLLAGANNFNNLQTTNVITHSSEPCLLKEIFANTNQLILHSKLDENKNDDDNDFDNLKCYDNQDDSLDTDEFFLVQYPNDKHEVTKSNSEPNVLRHFQKPFCYQKRLYEYYNDYADCLELYNVNNKDEKCNDINELSDSDIFNNIRLNVKSSSAPDILDKSFVMLTYDPGPQKLRRRSTLDTTFTTTNCINVIRYDFFLNFILFLNLINFIYSINKF